MNTKVDFSRTQWAGGQGFFHSGTVQLGARMVLYVYDCGSLNPSALTREIDIFRDRHGDEIDLLFLSHFHADHVNGLPELLAGAKVKSAVIPLVPAAERLYVFAHTLATDREISNWYRDLISDPGAALRDLGVAEVQGVEPQNVDESQQPDEEDFDLTPLDPIAPGTDNRDFSENPELVPGKRTFLSGYDAGSTGPPRVIWEWMPLVTAFARKRTDRFLEELAKALDIPIAELKAQISTPAGIKTLIKKHTDELKTAYSAVFPDLNLSSLIVYSGPAMEVPLQGRTYRTRVRVERGELHAWDIRPGWLGTGDQRMGAARCIATRNTYGSRLSRVGTLALPHHGSHPSLHRKLLTIFGDDNLPICSVSVGAKNSYNHPDRRVIMDVSSNGNHVVLVTDHESSRWTEAGTSEF